MSAGLIFAAARGDRIRIDKSSAWRSSAKYRPWIEARAQLVPSWPSPPVISTRGKPLIASGEILGVCQSRSVGICRLHLRHARFRQRPIDAQCGIVPPKRTFMPRRVIVRGLVEKFGFRRGHDESVRPHRHPQHALVFSRQAYSDMLTKRRRGAARSTTTSNTSPTTVRTSFPACWI